MKTSLLLFVILMTSQVNASEVDRTPNCFAAPMWNSALLAAPSMMVISPEKRDAVWAAIQKSYTGEFESLGLQPVLIEEDRTDFGALAKRSGPQAQVVLFKGSRYHQQTSPAVLTLMLCHEVGHHLGGDPKSSLASWASVEGQADYFSMADCWKRVTARLENENSLEQGLPAASRLLQILSGLRGELTVELGPSVRDESVAPFLVEGHTSVLCRWETFLRGWWGNPRPACWFPF